MIDKGYQDLNSNFPKEADTSLYRAKKSRGAESFASHYSK